MLNIPGGGRERNANISEAGKGNAPQVFWGVTSQSP